MALKHYAVTSFTRFAGIVVAIFTLLATGQGDLRFRTGDPFVFCTQGLKIPDPCWQPLPPYTGNYTLTDVCDPPNVEGRSWTTDDTESLAQYRRICPQAVDSGAWKGHARPESTPFGH